MMTCDVHTEFDVCCDRATLVLSGSLDRSELEDFAAALATAVRSGAHEIDIDLSAVPDMASEAVQVLQGAADTLECVHGYLCLRNPTPRVRDLLSTTALISG